VVAGSFYGRLFPTSSVHFITCCNALLWMDHLPNVPVRDFVSYRRPQPGRGPSVPPEVEAAFTQQAHGDLVRFLEARACELVPGGKLLIANPADDEQRRTGDGLYDVLNDACVDLVAAGRLERSRYERLTIPIYFRTIAETLAPLEEAGSPVRGAFTVEHAETLEVPTPFIQAFRAGGGVTAYADGFTGFLRAFSEPVVRAALVGEDGDPAVVDEVFDRIHARLLAEPERYLFHYLLGAVLLTRR
jgi:hypothetical protein